MGSLRFAVAVATLQLASAILGNTYNFRCEPGGLYTTDDPALAVGERSFICIILNGKVATLFNVNVDQFSAISIQGSNIGIVNNSGFLKEGTGWMPTIVANASERSVFYTAFDVMAHGVSSVFPKVYKRMEYSPSTGGVAVVDVTTIPVYTVIIELDRGKVRNIGWDDGCFFCAENTAECALNGLDMNFTTQVQDSSARTCRKTNAECYPQGLTTTAGDGGVNGTNSSSTAGSLRDSGCDLKLFVTWSGTDRNGQFLRSSGKRFSRYRAFGVATMYQNALNLASDAQNIANTAITAVQSVPGRIIPGRNEERLLSDSTGFEAPSDYHRVDLQSAPAGPPGLPDIVLHAAEQSAAVELAERVKAAALDGAEERAEAWMQRAAAERALTLAEETAKRAAEQARLASEAGLRGAH